MPLKPDELARLRTLTPALRLLFLAAEARGPWWGSTSEIVELAGTSQRRGELGLRELERGGWLVREEKGTRSYKRLVRFVPGPAAGGCKPRSCGSENRDPGDRGSAIVRIGEPRSAGSGNRDPGDRSTPYGTRARAPAPPDGSLVAKDPSDPSPPGPEAARPEGDQSFRGSDVQWLMRTFAVSGAIAHAQLQRLFALGADRREAREYLTAAKRGAHPAFRNMDAESVRFPLGVACSAQRFEAWRATRERPRPPSPAAPSDEPRMSPDEFEAAIEFARSKLR